MLSSCEAPFSLTQLPLPAPPLEEHSRSSHQTARNGSRNGSPCMIDCVRLRCVHLSGMGADDQLRCQIARLFLPRSYRDCLPQSASEAIRAPSAMAASLCQTTSDATYSLPAKVLKPQSVLAMMRSLSPIAATASRRRLATTCGCSTKFVVVSSTPGISSMCAGNGCSLSASYSC